jgi:hypothetical protein
MKKYLLVVIMVLSCISVCVADSTPAVSLKNGIIFKKEFVDLGDVDNIEFKAVIITDQYNRVTAKGLNITVPSFNGHSATVWLEVSDVEDFLKAIDYMIFESKGWDKKPLTNYTEVHFSVKDFFEMSFFSKETSKVKFDDLKLLVTARNSTKITEISQLEKMKPLITKALAILK